MTIEGLKLRVLKLRRKIFAKQRSKKLKNKDFTIISNNCWGGMTYESLNLPKQSPTVGMFFVASDFVKFCSDIPTYASTEITMISAEESKHQEFIKEYFPNGINFPIGKINDVELFFMHYHDAEIAKQTWERRCARINYDKMIVKFNDQNGCTEEDLKNFIALPLKNKLFFTCKFKDINDPCVIRIKQLSKADHIMVSNEPFGCHNKYLNIVNLINSL